MSDGPAAAVFPAATAQCRRSRAWQVTALAAVAIVVGVMRRAKFRGLLLYLENYRRRLGGLVGVLVTARLIAAPFFRLRSQVRCGIIVRR